MAEELNDQERRELERWRSGQRHKAMPTVKEVPDGITYAGRLLVAQGTEGGDEHDELLRNAGARLAVLTDVARRLLVDRDRVEASRQAWAEQAAHLKLAALDSVDRITKLRDGLAYGPDDNRWQVTRHHAYTEALAVLDSCFDAVMDDWPTAEAKRVCACVAAEQAVQIAAAGPLWSLPQCGVHLEGESQ